MTFTCQQSIYFSPFYLWAYNINIMQTAWKIENYSSDARHIVREPRRKVWFICELKMMPSMLIDMFFIFNNAYPFSLKWVKFEYEITLK